MIDWEEKRRERKPHRGLGIASSIHVSGKRHFGDYDGASGTDFAVWRPSDGTWYVTHSPSGAVTVRQWGLGGDVPAPADYDGDGADDFAVWRPATGVWWVRGSATGSSRVQPWGSGGDVPVPGDYGCERHAGFAVWRPSNGTWYLRDGGGIVTVRQWGVGGDVPAPGNYLGASCP